MSESTEGFLVFLVGMIINIHSDHILRNLRKPGEVAYRIPRGTARPQKPSRLQGLVRTSFTSAACVFQGECSSMFLVQTSSVRFWSGAVMLWRPGHCRPSPSLSLPSAALGPEPTSTTGTFGTHNVSWPMLAWLTEERQQGVSTLAYLFIYK